MVASQATNDAGQEGLTIVQKIQYQELTTHRKRFYCKCRAQGESHNIAMILASGQCPAMNRADQRMASDGVNGRYQAQLARFPDDPWAYCTSTADFVKKCKEIGATPLDGPVGVKTGSVPSEGAQKGPVPIPPIETTPELVHAATLIDAGDNR